MNVASRSHLWLAIVLAGCNAEPRPDPSPTSTTSATATTAPVPKRAKESEFAATDAPKLGGRGGPRRLDLRKAKPHVPVDILMKEELAQAKTNGQTVVLYVGAPWCEPCQYFHDAASRGELDATFPNLRVIEFNLDEDEARLQVADCRSRMIPLFSRVTAEGKCDAERRIMGSIKGPGAVTNITPRLQALLKGI